jgi:hypothetical protein
MTWTAEDLLPSLDFARENGTEGLLRAQTALDSILQSAQAPVQLEPFSSSPHRFVAASLCLLVVAACIVLGSARPHLRWTLVQLVCLGVALVFVTGGFDVLLPHTSSRNLLVEVAPRSTELQTVMLSAHYDSKTEPFDHVTRSVLLLAMFLLIPFAAVAQHRIEQPLQRWLVSLPAAVVVTLMAVQGLGSIAPIERSHGMRDNATACALIAELCSRALHQPLEHTRLQFAWWAAEEIGAQGSQAWVQHHAGELPDVVLNLELIGAGERLAVGGLEWTDRGLRRPDAELVQWLAAFDEPTLRILSAPMITDAGPFLSSGTRALTLLNLPRQLRWPRGMHSASDALSAVDLDGLDRTRDTVLALLLHLDAQREALRPAPADHRPAAVRQASAHPSPLLQSAP